MALEELTLLPETAARRAIGAGRSVALRVLRPPYPAIGVGMLRVLRVREQGDAYEITAGYDNYQRLADR